MRAVEWRGLLDGEQVFAMSGPGSDIEAIRYGHQYSEEGDVVLQRRMEGGKWQIACTFLKQRMVNRKETKR